MRNPFATSAMAAGYAADRPPVHSHIVDRICRDLADRIPVDLALDVGCGAGLSTRPLQRLARRRVGVEPVEAMVRAARTLDPGAAFTVGAAEALPVTPASVDLVTAAGSLNFTRLPDALRDIHRVLRQTGLLAAYDFATARSFGDDETLDDWYAAFVARYPKPPSEAIPLDPARLAAEASMFRLVGETPLRIPLPLTAEAYARYMLTETNVAAAVRGGTSLDDVRAWCEATLPHVFGGRARDVVFTGYIAYLTPGAGCARRTRSAGASTDTSADAHWPRPGAAPAPR
jgi:SAM-dependent methyltransferase